MALFNFGKKKAEKEITCACNAPAEETAADNTGCIKILGSGCKSCHALYENVQEAVKNMGVSVDVEYITDLKKVMTYGVMSMPGLVVNEKVVSVGKVLKPADVEKLLDNLGF